MGSTAIKTIKGKEYLYYIYYVDGKKNEKYCGLASNDTSKRKAIEFELVELKLNKNKLIEKIKQLEINFYK